MPDDGASPTGARELTAARTRRWDEVLGLLLAMLPPSAVRIRVEGRVIEAVEAMAGRLGAALDAAGRPCTRAHHPAADRPPALPSTAPIPATGPLPATATLSIATLSIATLGTATLGTATLGTATLGTATLGTATLGTATLGTATLGTATLGTATLGTAASAAGAADDTTDGPADIVIGLRTRSTGDDDLDGRADVVVDLHDLSWPVIRRVADRLGVADTWHVSESRAFFAIRATTWDSRFGDDAAAYAAAVADLAPGAGAVVVDVGCGTGRALPPLRAAVGTRGVVLGLDVTPQMLEVARDQGRARPGELLLGDARRLPLASGRVDAVFAAGLVHHLPDIRAGLAELARVCRPGGRLAIFHPSGRAALAARHGRTLRPDEPLAPGQLGPLLAAAGWRLDHHDDASHRFLALASRTSD
ncbi:class I SAM-dependent methyltransferase [Parafrankia sp. EUN1f]|uniref:class I SAM-dependent methyltransferase n=1 Tax=Parafrankia sp. EUN1f TaxID=102897 RepID=UPI00030C3A48|nr:class I SAM-dependent methyltransferase [Parafrankia sp. EUN1f]